MSTNYKILWQQLARHLINKKPFKHRDEAKMDQRFLEIYRHFVEKYGSHEKAAKKLYYHDEFTQLTPSSLSPRSKKSLKPMNITKKSLFIRYFLVVSKYVGIGVDYS